MAAVLLTAVTMMAKTETVPAPGNRLELTFSDEGGVANTAEVTAYIMANPVWRLSLQTHKLLGIR